MDGNRSSKEQELAYVANHEWKAEHFRYEIERLETYAGNFAIVDGHGTVAAQRSVGAHLHPFRVATPRIPLDYQRVQRAAG